MKKVIAFLAIAISLALPAVAADKAQAGPQGGRLLALDGQKAEFFVKPDRTVTITFYDEALKKVETGGQVVTATAEAPSGKTKLEFQPVDGILTSTTPLPEGDGYNIVVQVRPTADGKPKNFRITYLTHICDECKLVEYACICGH